MPRDYPIYCASVEIRSKLLEAIIGDYRSTLESRCPGELEKLPVSLNGKGHVTIADNTDDAYPYSFEKYFDDVPSCVDEVVLSLCRAIAASDLQPRYVEPLILALCAHENQITRSITGYSWNFSSL